MAIDFPANPTNGQTFTDPATGITYTWNGYGWAVVPAAMPVPPEVSFFQASGTLKYVSATELSFKPYNGNLIQINGKNYTIPDAGVPGLSNAGLTVNTLYYAYVYDNAGVVTAEFSAVGHSTSATPGNSGTEIKTGDDTRTLIGMVQTGVAGEFHDEPAYRYVRTWFNDVGLTALVRWPANITWSTAGGAVESTYTLLFLSWKDEWVTALFNTSLASNMADLGFTASLGLDGTPVSQTIVTSCTNAAYNYAMAVVHDMSVAEGFHRIGFFGNSGAGNFIFLDAVMVLRNNGSGA